MSSSGHSHNTTKPSTMLSLAEVRARILADETLPPNRRRDMASALTSLAKALGRPADATEADPVTLRPRISGLTPAMVGLKPGRWRNILSLASAALAQVGIVTVQGRLRGAPSPAWLGVLGLLPSGAGRHFHLWRFARWCTQSGLEPSAVTDAVITHYEKILASQSLVTEPSRGAREVARFWNEAAAAHPTWQQQRLTVPDNRRCFAPGWEAYPESLVKDVDAWCAGLGDSDPFSDRPFTPLKPASVVSRRKQIRVYLGALVDQGVSPHDMIDLKSVVTPARARRALRFFWDKAGCKATHHTSQLASLALMIARHWAGLSITDIQQLAEMAKRMRPATSGLSGRNMIRLRQLEDPERLAALIGTADRFPAAMLARRVCLLKTSSGTVMLLWSLREAVEARGCAWLGDGSERSNIGFGRTRTSLWNAWPSAIK